MSTSINTDLLVNFQQRLEQHPVYSAVQNLQDLRLFMEHHIYSVWDFMSLVKYLQAATAPTTLPWVPHGSATVRRFINELVLEEESDETQTEGVYLSHFELYLLAMQEIGADTTPAQAFIGMVNKRGVAQALNEASIPEASRTFNRHTFAVIDSDKPHCIAAALAFGREHIIPMMFRAILDKTGVRETEAPSFFFYLERHIHLDGGFHAPLSLQLVNELCGGNADKVNESIAAAEAAIDARLRFWDGVLTTMQQSEAA